MKEERINFGTILRIGLSLLPIILGLPVPAMVICSYNIAMSFLLCGPITCLVSSLSAICLSMLFYGIFGALGELQGLYLGVEAVLCALACVYAIHKKRGFYTGMWLASAGYLLPNCVNLYTHSAKAGQSIAQFLTEMPLEIARLQLEALGKQVGMQPDALADVFNLIAKMTVIVVPSMLVISSLLVGYAVMWFICAPLRKTPLRVEHSFAEIRAPRTAVICLVLSIAAAALIKNSTASYALLNIAIIFGSICFFAGMSTVDFYLRMAVKNMFLRLMIHFMIYTVSLMFVGMSIYVNIFTVYILVGGIGAFINIRKNLAEPLEIEGE